MHGRKFAHLSCPLQVKFVVRRTDLATGKDVKTYRALTVVEWEPSKNKSPVEWTAAMQAAADLKQLRQFCDSIALFNGGFGGWAARQLGTGVQEGVLRDRPNATAGGFMGVALLPSYDPDKYRYEVCVEFWSNGSWFNTYRDATGRHWLVVPRE